jgi:spore germination protein YaaH
VRRNTVWWRGGRWLLACVPLVTVPLVTVALVVVWHDGPGPAAMTVTEPAAPVVASMPYWAMAEDTAAVLDHRSAFTEASPWMYGLDASGNVVPQYSRTDGGTMATALAELRSAGLRLVPTLANVVDGAFAYQPVADVLHDPGRRSRHVADIVALVTREDYAGIDVDYEDLRAGDRQVFTDFVTELAAALHGRGKTLSVAVFAKADDAGYDERNQAQDYAAIGRVADQVRLMGYDYHWETSPPGPIAPADWIDAVLRYAVTTIPRHRIVLGVPVYGYDWIGSAGTPVTEAQAEGLASQYRAAVRWDGTAQAPWFTYTDGSGRGHEVWFENARSTAGKLALARRNGVAGVFLWLNGPPDDSTWSVLAGEYPPTEGTR